jgi:hypothetical protein
MTTLRSHTWTRKSREGCLSPSPPPQRSTSYSRGYAFTFVEFEPPNKIHPSFAERCLPLSRRSTSNTRHYTQPQHIVEPRINHPREDLAQDASSTPSKAGECPQARPGAYGRWPVPSGISSPTRAHHIQEVTKCSHRLLGAGYAPSRGAIR